MFRRETSRTYSAVCGIRVFRGAFRSDSEKTKNAKLKIPKTRLHCFNPVLCRKDGMTTRVSGGMGYIFSVRF